jgi:lysophospholipase L1-like esterase
MSFRLQLQGAAKNLLALLLGIVASLLLLEGFLRIYHPIETRVRANRIILPANRRYILVGGPNGNPTDTIVHTKNSLGFRGPEPPAGGLADRLSIIAVGGSTTECFYLSDADAWPAQVARYLNQRFSKVWMNNAGLVGHSTAGHIVLMNDYIISLRPRLVLFMAGANDVGMGVWHNTLELPQERTGLKFYSIGALVKSASGYSEVANVGLNLYRFWLAKREGLPDQRLRLTTLPLGSYPEPHLADTLALQAQDFVPQFRQRVTQLVQLAKQHNIDPVLITQPTLFGDAIDDVTGVDLRAVMVANGGDRPGHTQWRVMELYNEATRTVAQSEGVLLIDLAHKLPKSSRFFYDMWHFTKAGADTVAKIIEQPLSDYLGQHYPDFLREGTSTVTTAPAR